MKKIAFFLAVLTATAISSGKAQSLKEIGEVCKSLNRKDTAKAASQFAEIKKILEDSSYRNAMIAHLKEIKETMKGKKPSFRVASIVAEMAGWNNA